MTTSTRSVRSRLVALALLGSTLAATTAATVATVATVGLAGPAAAATPPLRGREADPVAEVATQALSALRALQDLRSTRAYAFPENDAELGAAVDTFTAARNWLAGTVAARAGVSADALDQVWRATSEARLAVVLQGLTQVGVPYRYARAVPEVGFDCSGFTSYAWTAAGIDLPHQSRSQIGSVAPSSLEQVLPGDLLYYPGHVMLAIGIGGAMIHAPHTGARIQVDAVHRGVRVGNPAPLLP